MFLLVEKYVQRDFDSLKKKFLSKAGGNMVFWTKGVNHWTVIITKSSYCYFIISWLIFNYIRKNPVNFDSLMSEPLSVFSLWYNYQFDYIYILCCVNKTLTRDDLYAVQTCPFICLAIKLISPIFNYGCVYTPDQTFIHNSWFMGENWINL